MIIRKKYFEIPALILFGIFLTFVLLEIVLRLGGFAFVLKQSLRNRSTFSENEFRILCLGESTTALGGENSYPSQLERILNREIPEKTFKVINAGEVSKTSLDLLNNLDKNLDRYKPHLVITMIGINDIYLLPRKEVEQSIPIVSKIFASVEYLRVYKLFNLLSQHLRETIKDLRSKKRSLKTFDQSLAEDKKIKEASLTYQNIFDDFDRAMDLIEEQQKVIDNISARMARVSKQDQKDVLFNKVLERKQKQYMFLVAGGEYQRRNKNYELAEKYLGLAQNFQPHDPVAYIALGKLYENKGEYKKAILVLEKARALRSEANITLMTLARCYDKMGDKQKVQMIYNYVLKEKNRSDSNWEYAEMGDWFLEHGFLEEAKASYLSISDYNQRDSKYLFKVAEICRQLGEKEKAREYLDLAQDRKKKFSTYLPVTINNYNKIIEKIRNRGVQVICMQYPLRDIEDLKSVFHDSSDLIFVENRTHFLKGIKEDGYPTYFNDYFAVDFGHCTHSGNKLIAENLAQVIINKFFYKSRR